MASVLSATGDSGLELPLRVAWPTQSTPYKSSQPSDSLHRSSKDPSKHGRMPEICPTCDAGESPRSGCAAGAGAVGVLIAPRRRHSTSAAAEASAIARASLADSLSAPAHARGAWRSFAGRGPLHGCPGMAGPELRARRRATGRHVPSARPCRWRPRARLASASTAGL